MTLLSELPLWAWVIVSAAVEIPIAVWITRDRSPEGESDGR